MYPEMLIFPCISLYNNSGTTYFSGEPAGLIILGSVELIILSFSFSGLTLFSMQLIRVLIIAVDCCASCFGRLPGLWPSCGGCASQSP
jgi:hypothetical protein